MVMAVPLIAAAGAGSAAAAAGASAMAAIQIGMGAMAAMSAIQGGQQQAAMYRYNADVQNMNARAARETGQYEAQRLSERNRRAMASQEAALASTGFEGGTGSQLDMLVDSARSSEMDRLSTIYTYETKARSYENQANSDLFAAKTAKSSSYQKAAGSLLQGAISGATSWSTGGSLFGPAAGANSMGPVVGVGPFQDTNMISGTAGTSFNAMGDFG